jgi:hypothetical protein
LGPLCFDVSLLSWHPFLWERWLCLCWFVFFTFNTQLVHRQWHVKYPYTCSHMCTYKNKLASLDKMFCHKQSNSLVNRVHCLPPGRITNISTACVWLIHEKFTEWHEQRCSSCIGCTSSTQSWRANRCAAKHHLPS